MTAHDINARQTPLRRCQFCADGIACEHGFCDICQVCRECLKELVKFAKRPI